MTRIEKYTKKFGEEKMIELIDECMASNYKGIIFEKLDKHNLPDKTKLEREKLKKFDNAHSEEATPEEMKEMDEFLKQFE